MATNLLKNKSYLNKRINMITKFILLINFIIPIYIQSHPTKKLLSSYKKIVFSQWGEDGIINEIINRIGYRSKTCIEFGAADGFMASNTANLWIRYEFNR